jgi:DNA modification methylase
MERYTIHNGDALAVLRSLPDESVDCVLTDPPYSSGTRKEAAKGLRKAMNREADDATWFDGDSLTVIGFGYLMREVARECRRVMKKGGHFLAFIDWRMLPHLSAAIESVDMRHAGVLVWDKTYFGMGACFRNQHEMILHFTKEQGAEPRRRDVGNVLQCRPIRGGEHPTEKPVELLRKLLSVVCPEGGTVLDPFAGSGSTGVACMMDGLRFVGIESSPTYAETSRQRIEQAIDSTFLKAATP